MSRAKHNWGANSEEYLNTQINMEKTAAYVYDALFCYFARDDVALKNVAKVRDGIRCGKR